MHNIVRKLAEDFVSGRIKIGIVVFETYREALFMFNAFKDCGFDLEYNYAELTVKGQDARLMFRHAAHGSERDIYRFAGYCVNAVYVAGYFSEYQLSFLKSRLRNIHPENHLYLEYL